MQQVIQMATRRHSCAPVVPSNYVRKMSLLLRERQDAASPEFAKIAANLCEPSGSLSNAQLLILGKKFADNYNKASFQERKFYLCHIASRYGVSLTLATEKAKGFLSDQGQSTSESRLYAAESLRLSVQPRYMAIFKAVAQDARGVKFLVDMREHILDMAPQISDSTLHEQMKLLSNHLKELLSLWFSLGLLHIDRVTWQSSCDLLEKITGYEAVHPVKHWQDIKRRVGPYRRCFVFTHPAMPREPIVVLHVALTKDISANIQQIIAKDAPSDAEERVDEALTDITSAIFYSVTSTQKGLQGIELGTFLIKGVLQHLRAELPMLKQFSSLSPIPGFSEWLLAECTKHLRRDVSSLLNDTEQLALAKAFDCEVVNVYKCLKDSLQEVSWYRTPLQDVLRPLLLRLCARYLYVEKHRGYALNSVANFHLRNGAVLWRLNWMGDTSPKGLKQSCGIMVNYRYYSEYTVENSEHYLLEQVIRADEQVLSLLDDTQLSRSNSPSKL